MNYFDNVPSPYIEYNIKNYIPLLRKKIKSCQVWELCDCGSDDCVDSGVVFCDDGIIILTHGNENGTIRHYYEILDILTNPLIETDILIYCCFPGYVEKTNPELRPYMVINYWFSSLYCFCKLEKGIIEGYIKESDLD